MYVHEANVYMYIIANTCIILTLVLKIYIYISILTGTSSDNPPEPKARNSKLVNVTKEPPISKHNALTTKHKRKVTSCVTGIIIILQYNVYI